MWRHKRLWEYGNYIKNGWAPFPNQRVCAPVSPFSSSSSSAFFVIQRRTVWKFGIIYNSNQDFLHQNFFFSFSFSFNLHPFGTHSYILFLSLSLSLSLPYSFQADKFKFGLLNRTDGRNRSYFIYNKARDAIEQ